MSLGGESTSTSGSTGGPQSASRRPNANRNASSASSPGQAGNSPPGPGRSVKAGGQTGMSRGPPTLPPRWLDIQTDEGAGAAACPGGSQLQPPNPAPRPKISKAERREQQVGVLIEGRVSIGWATGCWPHLWVGWLPACLSHQEAQRAAKALRRAGEGQPSTLKVPPGGGNGATSTTSSPASSAASKAGGDRDDEVGRRM